MPPAALLDPDLQRKQVPAAGSGGAPLDHQERPVELQPDRAQALVVVVTGALLQAQDVPVEGRQRVDVGGGDRDVMDPQSGLRFSSARMSETRSAYSISVPTLIP